MNDFDEQDPLWKLLGKAKNNAVSPLFARNVLREVRLSRDARPVTFSWLRVHWRLASVCTLGALLLSVNASRVFVLHKAPPPVAQVTQPAGDAIKPGDTEVVNHLDELVAYEENSIWLEDSSE